MKIEEILQTTKSEHETWADVFKRIDETRGIDHKTLTNVVIYLLEKQDEKTTFSGESYGIDEGTGRLESKDTGIQDGDRQPKEEIRAGLTDTSKPIHS